MVTETPRGFYRDFGKRVLDILIVLAASPLVLPALLVIGVITALDGGRPFYGQPRVGRNGQIFRCWKIRTMVPNAEKALQELVASDPEIAREWKLKQKLVHDPRITRWGMILRKTSMDELPQLLNVLTGQMSLIGPRPFTPDQKPIYDELGMSSAYYHLRPGITGLWQVECRSKGTFTDRVSYDEAYDRQLSFWTDFKIALRTVRVILQATGK